jgi:hypothetical protein
VLVTDRIEDSYYILKQDLRPVIVLQLASLEMNGPFGFTSDEIDDLVADNRIGNYALGTIDKTDGKFIVRYVGRSDSDVKAELKNRLALGYPNFKFSYADSKKDAFDKECRNYHDFGGKKLLRNERHPDRPEGMTNLNCPIAGCKELE